MSIVNIVISVFQIFLPSEDGGSVLILVALTGTGVFLVVALFSFLATRNVIREDMEEIIAHGEGCEIETSDAFGTDREKTVFLIEDVNDPVFTRRETIESLDSSDDINVTFSEKTPRMKSQIVTMMLRMKKLWRFKFIHSLH